MERWLLLFCCLGCVAPAVAQWKTFTESRSVEAKNKAFVCKYQLKYKGSLTVDAKKSRVACTPDSRGSFGTVAQTFVIGRNTAEVVHEVRKGKDKIKKISIGKLTTTPTPTTAAPTTAAPTTTQGSTGTGTGGGTGGTGGGAGGTGGTGGEEMSCSCKLPLLDNSSLAESGRKLSNVVSRVLERKKRSAERETPILMGGGHHHPSNSYDSGNSFGSLIQLLVLASLAALAAYGKVTLIQNLAGLLERSLNTEIQEQEEAQARILSILTRGLDRQDLGGILGELGGLLGGLSGTPAPSATPAPSGTPAPSEGGGGTSELLEGLIGQVLQQQINEFLTGGSIENILTSLLNTEDMGLMVGEMMNSLIGNMDTEAMITYLSEQLGNDLGQIVSMLDEAMAGTNMTEVLSAMMGGMPEGQMESLLEGVNLNTMEVMMNCECKKKN